MYCAVLYTNQEGNKIIVNLWQMKKTTQILLIFQQVLLK